MRKGIVRSMELRIRTASMETADIRYKEKVAALAHDLAGDFEKSLNEALISALKAHVFLETESHKDFMFGNVTDTVTIGYDVSVAMDMDAAADALIDKAIICATKKEVKEDA